MVSPPHESPEPAAWAPGPPATHRIEWVALEHLARAERNPKRHDLDALVVSLRRFGFVSPLLVDERTGRLAAGHGRLDALEAMQAKGEPPPRRVRLDGHGRWLVPVIRGVGFESEAEGEAYLVADNQLVFAGGWDEEALGAILRELPSLDGLGFSEEDLRRLIDSQADPEEDEIPEAPATPVTQPGDLWVLGDHRLLCGDSTDPEVRARLFDGACAQLLVTDPPYGVDYSDLVDSRVRQKKGGWPDIANDALDDVALLATLTAALGGEGAHTAFVWHAQMARRFLFWEALKANGWAIRQEIVWVKQTFVFGRADYHWQHEPCIYARRGSGPPQSDRTQTTVWAFDKTTGAQHPTQKPVGLFAKSVELHTARGDVAFDPFVGSGTLLMACEQLGRRGYGLELEPRYCDVVVERWERYTGRKATR